MKPIIHSDPQIMGGTPVFYGTRVPVQSLIDWIEGDCTLAEWLDNFPSVSKEQVMAFLITAKERMLQDAHESASR